MDHIPVLEQTEDRAGVLRPERPRRTDDRLPATLELVFVAAVFAVLVSVSVLVLVGAAGTPAIAAATSDEAIASLAAGAA